MKHHIRLFTILTAASAMLLAPSAFAQGFGGGHGPRGHHRGGFHGHGGLLGPRIAQALELDDAQRQQLQTLRSEMRQDLQPVHEDLQALRSHLGELWSAETPDRAAILQVSQQMDTLRDVIRDRQTELRLAALQVLTPEQRAELTEMQAQRRERMGQRGQRGDGQPGERMGRRGQGPRRGHGLAQRLELTDEQRAQAQALRQATREQLQPIHTQMRELRQALRSQWRSGQPDAAAIESIQDQMDALESTIRVQRIDSRLALLDLLTPEQRQTLAEMPRRGRHHGHGPGHRGGRGQRGAGPQSD